MKTFALHSIFLTLLLLSFSCREVDKDQPPQSDQEKIQGNWQGVHHSIYSYNAVSGDTSFALHEYPGDFWARFKPDGSYQLIMEENTINDTLQGSYQLEGSLLSFYSPHQDSSTALLLRLDANNLIFEIEEIDSNDIFQAYYEFMR